MLSARAGHWLRWQGWLCLPSSGSGRDGSRTTLQEPAARGERLSLPPVHGADENSPVCWACVNSSVVLVKNETYKSISRPLSTLFGGLPPGASPLLSIWEDCPLLFQCKVRLSQLNTDLRKTCKGPTKWWWIVGAPWRTGSKTDAHNFWPALNWMCF